MDSSTRGRAITPFIGTRLISQCANMLTRQARICAIHLRQRYAAGFVPTTIILDLLVIVSRRIGPTRIYSLYAIAPSSVRTGESRICGKRYYHHGPCASWEHPQSYEFCLIDLQVGPPEAIAAFSLKGCEKQNRKRFEGERSNYFVKPMEQKPRASTTIRQTP